MNANSTETGRKNDLALTGRPFTAGRLTAGLSVKVDLRAIEGGRHRILAAMVHGPAVSHFGRAKEFHLSGGGSSELAQKFWETNIPASLISKNNRVAGGVACVTFEKTLAGRFVAPSN